MRLWLLMTVGLMGAVGAWADPFASGAACPTATLADYIASPGGCTFGGGTFYGFSESGAIPAANVLVTPIGIFRSNPFNGIYSGFTFSGVNGPLYSGSSSAATFMLGYYLGVTSTQRINSAELGVTFQNASDQDFYVGSRLGIVGGPAVNYYADPGSMTPVSTRKRESAVATPFGDLTVFPYGGAFPTAYTFTTTLVLQPSTDAYQITSLDQTFYIPPVATPEPATCGLLAAGLLGLLIRRSRSAC